MRRVLTPWAAVILSAFLAAGCATSRAVQNAEKAAARGDYDSAVAYYRQALANEPQNVDFRIQLERATRVAASDHVRRARELEAQDQLAGALAEYKLAADLDPASPLAATKAAEIERRIRTIVEASRPQPRIEALRQQAAQASPIPRIDPRTRVTAQFTSTSVRDVLSGIGLLTGITITYDQAGLAQLTPILSQPYSIEARDMSLEDVLGQIMQATGLTFKVTTPQTIFVYQDTSANRTKYEDQYMQTFYLSHSDPKEIMSLIQAIVTTSTGGVAPKFQPSPAANAIVVRASAPVLDLVESLIRANDRPVPEVMVEAEILEVDRVFIRQLGIDLSQYALGFTFSPELAPPNTATVPNTFPTQPPPFNLNTISRGVSAADFYLTSPTALIRLLESNQTTKVLAKPSSRGRAGQLLRLTLGDSIPIPQTSFQSIAAGGISTTPVTQVQYTEVGINLSFTPQVSYQDEIVLDQLVLEKSGLGPFIEVAGQSFPTINRRRAEGSMRLRDGESNLIAGLLRDEDRKTLKSFPGFTSIPILRSLFGNSDAHVEQTDIVMIITPHIVRSRELTPEDLRPKYVGAGNSIGGSAPSLISPDAIGVTPQAPAGAVPVPGPGAAPVQAPAPGGAVNITPAAPAGPAVMLPPSRPAGVVPIEAVPSAPAAPGAIPPLGPPARITLTAPTAPGGTLAAGTAYTLPITIVGAPPLATLTLTLTYDPGVLRMPTVTQGTFMSQGGVSPTFVPRVDQATGRVDIVLSRPSGQAGASTSGLVGALAFVAGTPGATDVTITGVATSPSGQSLPLDFTPVRLVVK